VSRWLAAAALGLAACASPAPFDPFAPRAGAAQERRFDGVPPQALAEAALQVLQDSSFLVTSSDQALGLIIGTRGASTKSVDELTADMLRGMGAVTMDAFTFRLKPEPEDYMPGALKVVVHISPAASGSTVRVTFHSVAVGPYGSDTGARARELPGPELHQKFFAPLEQALKR
jgi:hypothetical protein